MCVCEQMNVKYGDNSIPVLLLSFAGESKHRPPLQPRRRQIELSKDPAITLLQINMSQVANEIPATTIAVAADQRRTGDKRPRDSE